MRFPGIDSLAPILNYFIHCDPDLLSWSDLSFDDLWKALRLLHFGFSEKRFMNAGLNEAS